MNTYKVETDQGTIYISANNDCQATMKARSLGYSVYSVKEV